LSTSVVQSILEDIEEVIAREKHMQLEVIYADIVYHEGLIDFCRRDIGNIIKHSK